MEHAEDHDLLLRLYCRPGDFVAEGRPLIDTWPAETADEEVCSSLRQAFAVGNERTPAGDLNFLINELVEIGIRALSTGINDPITAISCLDWLGAALSELAGRSIPDSRRTGKDGIVRVIALPDDFSSFVQQSLGRLRLHVSREPIAAAHALHTIGLVASSCRNMDQIAVLDGERQRLMGLVRRQLAGAALESTEEINGSLESLLEKGAGQIDERQAASLGGSA